MVVAGRIFRLSTTTSRTRTTLNPRTIDTAISLTHRTTHGRRFMSIIVDETSRSDCPKCGMALGQDPAFQEEAKAIFTCPMHPEIRQDQPGYCPICGMALEPVAVTGEPQGENSEAKDMTLRLWIATILTAPVSLLAMAHFIPALHLAHWIPPRLNQWIQFLFATPVVLWAGWPFLSAAGIRFAHAT